MRLRAIEDQKDKIDSHAKYIAAISKSEDILKPFLQACESKNLKMITIAVGAIQKLISHNGIATVCSFRFPSIPCRFRTSPLTVIFISNKNNNSMYYQRLLMS